MPSLADVEDWAAVCTSLSFDFGALVGTGAAATGAGGGGGRLVVRRRTRGLVMEPYVTARLRGSSVEVRVCISRSVSVIT